MLCDHVIPMKLTSLVDKSVGYIITVTLLFYCFKFSNVVWFPSLPMWARRAVLHELTESTRDSIASFLAHKCLVPRLEDDCRHEVRPAEAESQEWQALKHVEIEELQRFSKEERRLMDEESAIRKKEMELEVRKVTLSQERKEAAKELEEIKSDSRLHLNDTRSKRIRRMPNTVMYITVIEGPLTTETLAH